MAGGRAQCGPCGGCGCRRAPWTEAGRVGREVDKVLSALAHILGPLLMVCGLAVTVLFWVPRLVDRTRLRELLGPRYGLVYIIYAANGPGLALLGLLLWLFF